MSKGLAELINLLLYGYITPDTLACKLFMCQSAENVSKLFTQKINKLRAVTYKYNLPTSGYFLSKEEWLKRILEETTV